MLMIINGATHRNEWVLYTLTDDKGECVHIDIVKFTELTNFPNVKVAEYGTLYLNVIDKDEDRMKLANRGMRDLPSIGKGDLQWKIRDIVASWSHGNKKHGHPIMCVETGQEWSSLKACADDQGLSYSQLLNHVKGNVGYKSVKGQTYRKVES